MASDRFAPPRRLTAAAHGIVHRDPAAVCGWPFLGGFWGCPDGDLLVAFQKKPADYGDPAAVNHDEVARHGPRIVTRRSRDQGRSWGGMALLYDLGADRADPGRPLPEDWADLPPVDFTDPATLIASGATPDYFRPASRGWIRVSTDAGATWRPPIQMRMSGLPSVSGNGSALVRADGVALQFVTVVTEDGWHRRPAVFRAAEAGAPWAFMSYITPELDDGAGWADRSLPIRFSPHRYFYPRAILLPSGRILCSLRGQRDPTSVFWTEIFASDDGGRSWAFLSRVNDWGAPGDLARMADGRIACVYGWRMPPWGIRLRLSQDEGRSWGRELILRDDGGSWDLGYPRVTEIAPGQLLAVYYFNRADDPVQQNGGIRHIACSRFDPDAA
jgi:hypothetical protein